MSRLTIRELNEMRALRHSGNSMRSIALAYGIDPKTAYYHLKDEPAGPKQTARGRIWELVRAGLPNEAIAERLGKSLRHVISERHILGARS